MNADLDRRYADNQHGAYAFRIHGGVCHLMSSVLISEKDNAVQQPRFAQIYIFDSRNELQNRMNVAGNQDVSREIMRILQNIMHEVNPFDDLLKSMEELSSEREGGLEETRKVFRAENVLDPRRYSIGTNVIIEAIIATRPKAGNIALIPKIKFITLAT
ncbi:hypothetical protein MAM1_0137c06321 [Mucor ambiguus]|uniref:Helitron helicase-like domain-containing protein n=1 Tax=Mucor ambiguus TaxID=91626 RepID=A0A0C9M8Z1_9FUNG|nr:hypothetical protein MAM1_0137c06321 [Mucor ambiguus]